MKRSFRYVVMASEILLRVVLLIISLRYTIATDKILNNGTEVSLFREDYDGCNETEQWEILHYESKAIRQVSIQKDYQKIEPPMGRIPIQLYVFDAGTTLSEINEERKTITLDIQLVLLWQDCRIRATFLDRMDMHILPPILKDGTSLIWAPGTEIENLKTLTFLNDPIKFNWVFLSASDPEKFPLFGPNATLVNTYIEWHVEISCVFDFSDYPFDVQICGFRMLLWESNVTYVAKIPNPLNDTLLLSENATRTHGFIVQKHVIEAKQQIWPETVFEFGKFGYDIKMKRIFRPYFYQYYIPCALIVIASCLSFIIPISAVPGRIGLVVTQFLTLTNLFINQKVRKWPKNILL